MTPRKRRTDPKAEPEAKAYKSRLTVHVPPELVEEARDCAFWTRRTLARIVADGLRVEIDRLRADENKGKPFPRRSGELRTGRPFGS